LPTVTFPVGLSIVIPSSPSTSASLEALPLFSSAALVAMREL